MNISEGTIRRLDSIIAEAYVIIHRAEDAKLRCNIFVHEEITEKLNEGAQQIQLDVAALDVLRATRIREDNNK